MERISIEIEELANILMAVGKDPDVVEREYCEACLEMHDGMCAIDDATGCPHEEIAEFRFFIRRHFKKYIVRSD